MAGLRINGLVGNARRLQEELAGGVSPARLEQLRGIVAQLLKQLDAILAGHGRTLKDLPVPSQRAVHFLRGIDWAQIQPSDSPASPRATTLSWPYLPRLVEFSLQQMETLAPANWRTVFDRVVQGSQRVEQYLRDRQIDPARLTAPTRQARGWVALMSDERLFNQYLEARDRAARIFNTLETGGRFPPPVRVQFRPMKVIWRIRGDRKGSLLQLALPAITFDDAQLQVLARIISTGDRAAREEFAKTTLSGPYLELQHRLEEAEGIVQQTGGMAHDLAASFDRVNAAYFASAMPRPRLHWSKRLTGRKFGHYNAQRDEVMLSRTLDQPHVPDFVIDYVMYHELLHKREGIRWQNGRRRSHHADFHAEERKFPRYAEADAFLKKLARQA